MKAPHDARARGEAMERIAASWLIKRGLQLRASNQHAKGGEIDLVMQDGDTLVFVEVKHRTTSHHGHPLEMVTPTKQRRLVKAALFYLQRNRLSCPCRFDVLAVTGRAPTFDFHWVKGAFEAF